MTEDEMVGWHHLLNGHEKRKKPKIELPEGPAIPFLGIYAEKI